MKQDHLFEQVGVCRQSDTTKYPLIPVGTKFGLWTVIENDLYITHGQKKPKQLRACRVQCSCKKGTIRVLTANQLKRGEGRFSIPQSCGCQQRDASRTWSWGFRRPLIPVGTKFGQWTVIETGLHVAYGLERRRACRVQCSCETISVLSCNHLTRGQKRFGADYSCGCRMKEIFKAKYDLIPVGTAVGWWVVVENGLYKDFPTQTHRAVRARCRCGTIKILSCSELRDPRWPSCGCKSRQRDIETVWRELHHALSGRGWEFELTVDELKVITQLPCSYCGKEPSNLFRLKYNDGGKHKRCIDPSMQIRWSGLDRVDSTKGYLHGNVVPCCRECNVMKNDWPLEKFLNEKLDGKQAHLDRIRSHGTTAADILGIAAGLFDEANMMS